MIYPFKNFYKSILQKNIIYNSWEEISVNELNQIRDDLYNYELYLQKNKFDFLLMNKTNKKLWQNLKML